MGGGKGSCLLGTELQFGKNGLEVMVGMVTQGECLTATEMHT